MSMILSEGRKEDAYKKFQKSIDAERKMISTYMDDVSAYDFLLDEPFIKETNYKYLNDILESHYALNQYSGEAEPLEKIPARELLFSIRRQIDEIALALETFEKYKSKFKFPEFRKYIPYNIDDFVIEAKKILDEALAKQKEKSAKKDVKKIFENDNILIVKPLSHTSSCYYGAGTKWCTTMAGTPSYFQDYSKNGSLYYLILKGVDRNNKFYKMAINTRYGQPFPDVWYDSTDERLTKREIEAVLAHLPKDALNAMKSDHESSAPKTNLLNSFNNILVSKGLGFINLNQPPSLEKLAEGKSLVFIIKNTPSIHSNLNGSNPQIRLVFDYSVLLNDKKTGERYNVDYGTIKFILKEKNENEISSEATILSSKTGKEENVKLFEPKKIEQSSVSDVWVGNFIRNSIYRLSRNVIEKEIKKNDLPKIYGKSYTFTGLGDATKKFFEYMNSLPEGKTGSRKDFLISIGREPRPGYFSSFFSALNKAGITMTDTKGRISKGENYDKYNQKISNQLK